MPRPHRWLIPAALLALMPKCLLCALAYAGLGATLGLGGPELCGGANPALSWMTALTLAGLVLGLAGVLAWTTAIIRATSASALPRVVAPPARTRPGCR